MATRRRNASPDTPSLFGEPENLKPLAERMRPRTLDEVVGQDRLLGPGTALRRELEAGRVHSMVLWGPPGCGKTTLALLIAKYANAEFEAISAVLSGLPHVREALARAEARFAAGQRTVLFIDEVHRFNKAQQDAFLPHVEKGIVVLIGATTENPSFELNSALLSRCRVHVLDAVTPDAIVTALARGLHDAERGLANPAYRPDAAHAPLEVDPATLETIARASDGDVRRALTLLEIAADLAENGRIDEKSLSQVLADRTRRFDKGGEQFYDQISALHKSVRSSHPDAALYWTARMLDGGVDPNYLARRITRMAIEDIGLGDPRAVEQAIAAWDTYKRLGSPEGDLALVQMAVYLALAPKSVSVYEGYNEAKADIRELGTLDVPLDIRNAPTKLMKELGYGKQYQYDPHVEGGVSLTQQLMPDALLDREYYRPAEGGFEGRVRERLHALREARRDARGRDGPADD